MLVTLTHRSVCFETWKFYPGISFRKKIPFDYSCKNGTCGLLHGKAYIRTTSYEKNYALTEDQVKAGYRLLCQSYPVNNQATVVIE